MVTKKLTKTITFGLLTMHGFDKKHGSLLLLDGETRKKIYENLFKCFRDFAKLCNYTTSLYYSQRILGVDLQDLGFSTSYTQIVEKMQIDTPLASRVMNQAHNLAKTHFTGDHGKSLMGRGDRVLSTHRADGTHPIYFHKDASELIKYADKFYICYNLFASDWASDNHLPSWIAFEIRLKDRDKVGRNQLENIVNQSWEMGGTRLVRNPRQRSSKYLTQISVRYEAKTHHTLSPSTVMGVYLGVHSPAVIHFRTNGEPFHWEFAIGDGQDMLASKRIIKGDIKRIIQILKTKSGLITGVKRQIIIKKLRELRRQERQMIKTTSQKIASTIAEQAKRNGAGIWQLRKCDQSTRENFSFVARHWAAGSLIEALKWQATQLGAKLEVINPYKTSQRCSHCGHIEKQNRLKEKQDETCFECACCGYKTDMDRNAARNFSIIGIEMIISQKMSEIMVL